MVYIPIGVGCCCFIHRIGMREPDNRIKPIVFPHLFYLLIFPEGTGKNIKHNFMSEEMRKSVSLFCNQQPNLDDLHHPNDIARLIKVIYLPIIIKTYIK